MCMLEQVSPADALPTGEIYSFHLPNRNSMRFAARRFLQLPQHRVQIEGRWLLARRELLERLDLLGHERLHSIDKISVRNHKIPVGI